MLKKVVFSLLLSTNVFASVSRMEEKAINIASVNPVYLSFGRAALLEFPCEVKKVTLGLTESYRVFLDKNAKKELAISMVGEVKHPSNMLVRCDRYLLVFDLIPSEKVHQANLRITNLYENSKEKGARKLVVKK